MAYGKKYSVEWTTPTRDCRLFIDQEGYSGSVTSLVPADPAFTWTVGQQGPASLQKPVRVTTGTIRVIGDSDATGLQETFDAGDTEYRVRFQRDLGGYELEWQGYVKTGLWKDNPHREWETVEVEVIDGMVLLENQDFDPSSSDDLYSTLRSILRGLHELDVAANMQWYPYRDNNQLSGVQLPLGELTTAQNAFDELEPIEGEEGFETTANRNKRRVLKAILERFGMELVQSRGEWVARQRGEIQSNGTLKVWPDKSAVDNDNPKTRDLTRTLGALRPRKHPRSLTERLRTTESVHVYDNLGELVRNGSFEGSGNGSLDGWSGGQVKNYSNISRLSRQPTQEDGYAAVFNGTTISQDVPAIIHDAGPKSALKIDFDFVQNENSTPNLLWAETRIALDNTWYIQGRNPDIPNKVKSAKDGTLALGSTLNGNNGTLLIPSGTTLPVFEFIGNATHSRVTLTEPAYAGDDALQCQIPRDIPAGSYLIYWVWSDTQTSHTYNGSTTNYWGLHVESKDYPGSIDGTTLKPQKIQVPMHAPDGTNLAGRDLSFAIETDTDAKGFLDHVSAQLVINDEPVEQTSYTALDDQSGRNIEITQLLGDGPRFGHPRRLQLSGVDLTQDWKVGPYAAGDARSGQLIEEITAEAAMRQQRDTLQRRTHTVELRGSEELWPQDVFTINGDLYTVTYMQRSFGTGGDRVRVELTRLKDAGTSGLERTFQMESGTAGSAGGTTGGRGGSGGGGSVSAAWSDIIDKPTGFLVRDGDSDGFSDTLPATKAQIESWMRTLTGRSNRSDTRGQ